MQNAVLAQSLLCSADTKAALSKLLSPEGSRRGCAKDEPGGVAALRRPGTEGLEYRALTASTVGGSEAMQKLRSQVGRIAPYFRTALITGPVGTGKVDVARMLHGLSPFRDGEFVACEASAMAEAMLREDGRAVIEAASGGTLYLDDVGEVPPALQGALLRIWTSVSKGRMRVVAGTHRNLHTMSVTGQFRQDLAQRLMGVELAMTALRDRREDLPAVIREALKRAGGERPITLTDTAMTKLMAHSWPEDVLEVEKVMAAAVRAAEGGSMIEAAHLPELFVEENEAADEVMEKLHDVLQRHVLDILTRCAGNKLRAAEVLGISRSTLYRMLESCVGDGFAGF